MATLEIAPRPAQTPVARQPQAARLLRPSALFIVVTTAIWWGGIIAATMRLIG